MELFGPLPTAQDIVSLEGELEKIVYENPDNGFYVARLRTSTPDGLVTLVGSALAVSPGETVRVWGRWESDPRFGRQLRIERYETLLPSTTRGIEKFLGSGLIKGIGPKFAKRIVDAFGIETLRVIRDDPDRISKVAGIGRKRAASIQNAFTEQQAVQSIMVFLQGQGIGLGQAIRIYKRYGDRAVAVLRENPYRLAEDVAGISFKIADTIAGQMGVAIDAPMRLEAGLLHVLRLAAGNGHVYLPKESLIEEAAAALDAPADPFVDALARLADAGHLIVEDSRVFLRELHRAELTVAQRLGRLLSARKAPLKIDAERAIAWVEQTFGKTLSEGQREAVRKAATAPVLIITGGPGTGKTTVLNGLLAIFEKKELTVALGAPTGRAAKRMTAATDREAKTIHRLLEYSARTGSFVRNVMKPLGAEVIVIDEMSMVDVQLMQSLLEAAPDDARLILVGDVDQLPSVGPGSVLMDLILSLAIPTVRLEQVFRQAAQSAIVANAHRINRGEVPEFNTTDFFYIDRPDAAKALETIVELVTERMPRKFGLDPRRDIQVLAPMHRGDAGVQRLNEALQEALNPGGAPIPRGKLRVGDKVMQLRNNYELDIYNGDVGYVQGCEMDLQELRVVFDDRIVLYDFSGIDDLALAYAATIHKAQGSEYPAVVLPILSQHYVMLQRNVLYTAITRASQRVVIVGDERALRRAVKNVEVTARHTALAERLRKTIQQHGNR